MAGQYHLSGINQPTADGHQPMTRKTTTTLVWFITAMIVALSAAPASPGESRKQPSPRTGQSFGPDVICSDIYSYKNWGVENNIAAFSVGTLACNKGTSPVNWHAGTSELPDNRHPVIAQNLYRYKDGRFLHIGQSWLKHGFCAVDGEDFCFVCQKTNDCGILGVGCSDPYAAELNGAQGGLSPKYQVNPANGSFSYPLHNPAYTGIAARRLQVSTADLPTGVPQLSDRFYVEAQYLAADDSIAGNAGNNVSYRQVNFLGPLMAGFPTDTVAEKPAIYAWQAIDPEVEISVLNVPFDGRFILGYRVTHVGRDYIYEYALYNQNSDRAGRSLTVPAREGVVITLPAFHDVNYHSGEPYDNTDWAYQRTATELKWSGGTFSQNTNANALRWGTLYNFSFRSNRPPRSAHVRLELFKPNTPSAFDITALAPTPLEDINMDGEVDSDDLMLLFGAWASTNISADLTSDGMVDVKDLFALLAAWGM